MRDKSIAETLSSTFSAIASRGLFLCSSAQQVSPWERHLPLLCICALSGAQQGETYLIQSPLQSVFITLSKRI